MAPAHTEASRRETCIGALILLFLIGIAAGVVVKQSHFDESILSASLQDNTKAQHTSVPPSTAGSLDLQPLVPPDMTPLAPAEAFGPDTLSDKIDGKAELYLSAGFLNMVCQRFAEIKKPDAWMEVFVYDMGSFQNAFAVFSAQRRSEARQLDIAKFAYGTENAVFFVHGREYIEIVGASSSKELSDEMLSFSRSFISATPAEAEQVSESSLFPTEGLQEGTISLLASDAFGFDRLDNVFIASYTVSGASQTGFLSLRASDQEATELASAYLQFLVQNGGSDLGAAEGIPGSHVVKLFDTYEVLFSHGRAFAGIHEADNKEAAEQLALALHRRIEEANR